MLPYATVNESEKSSRTATRSRGGRLRAGGSQLPFLIIPASPAAAQAALEREAGQKAIYREICGGIHCNLGV
jgi:hypothetical protein